MFYTLLEYHLCSICVTVYVLQYMCSLLQDIGHHKVITMATQAAVHKRNLESSILFMQTEHAQTLKGLHEEIKNLQKKCSGNPQKTSSL